MTRGVNEFTLSQKDIHNFVHNGFVKIENAFSKELVLQCQSIICQKLELDLGAEGIFAEPVIRIASLAEQSFLDAANSSKLHSAYSQLVGNNWKPLNNFGSIVVRLPSEKEPVDTGWHVDASFPGTDPSDYLNWRVNIASKGRALLMLFLFTDVGLNDAPTRIKVSSHLRVAGFLHEYGRKGLSVLELAKLHGDLPDCQTELAIGKAGTVYLCHPFLVHAAQKHQGVRPRILGQPPLLSKRPFQADIKPICSPVEQAIRQGLM